MVSFNIRILPPLRYVYLSCTLALVQGRLGLRTLARYLPTYLQPLPFETHIQPDSMS